MVMWQTEGTYISKVEVEEAPLVPAVLDNHKSYETSATKLEAADE